MMRPFRAVRKILPQIRKIAFAAIPICVVAGAGFAAPSTETSPIEWDELEIGEEVTVEGTLAVYGTEPHTYLAVAVEDKSLPAAARLVQIDGELVGELGEIQGRVVSVRGTIVRLETGPGFPVVVNALEYQLEGTR